MLADSDYCCFRMTLRRVSGLRKCSQYDLMIYLIIPQANVNIKRKVLKPT